jgi:ferritin-like metal-binding protein YciE
VRSVSRDVVHLKHQALALMAMCGPGHRFGCPELRQHSGVSAQSPLGSCGETPMTIKTMEDLFVETLKDIYYAEKHILKALPSMVKKAGSRKLKEALETHRKETEGQVDRLDQVFKLFDVAPRGKKCEAIEGILAEAKEHMEDIEDAEVLDAGMIGSAQAVEHYEITRYGTLIAWAKQLGRDDAIRLLEANLEQEKKADRLLTEIAVSAVNEKAAA